MKYVCLFFGEIDPVRIIQLILTENIDQPLMPVGAFIIVDGINHAITCNGYRSLNYQNIPIFFYLNANRCLFSHLSGINILDATATAECLQSVTMSCLIKTDEVCVSLFW